ncbi:Microtubule-associated protein, MAP65/Ase1/PRC [Parasponia andersonii]|uniref:Microtubule-associated protein, MAP65/Ase1/PRC n=1 Tax=Parasponia andersonii TaxID=3476 RepID=A0A2P5BHV2_PARAD|nr:Microtubule-associated protein, MAP65/Ase1/PRC [Parasponia andersonii]
MKKRSELDEICRQAHMIPEAHGEYSFEAIASEMMDPECLLEQIELQIARAKAEALSRKEILEKVEKWLAACQEECWLEDYNKDDKRYHAGRGTHLTLKRAEKARAVTKKIPAIVETLILKTTAWETERGAEFLYDSGRLLSMLEQYRILRQEKEQDWLRQSDEKKRLGQLIAEKEARYGSQPSPAISKGYRVTGFTSDRRLSRGGDMLQKLEPQKATLSRRPTKYGGVAGRLLSMLEQYRILRQEKEQDWLRQRDEKKRLGQLIAEKEARYGSQPSPASSKGYRVTEFTSDRRLSRGGDMLQKLEPQKATLSRRPTKSGGVAVPSSGKRDSEILPTQYSETKHSKGAAKAREIESPLLRKPLTPSLVYIIAGKRDSEILPTQYSETKHSKGAAKAREIESPLLRKPLTPVFSSIASSKANIANDHREDDDQKRPTWTPTKPVIVVGGEGNKTPTTTPILVPNTPTTLSSVAMLTAKTPPTPCVLFCDFPDQQPIEYSFEEENESLTPDCLIDTATSDKCNGFSTDLFNS